MTDGIVLVCMQCEEAAKHFGVVALRDISASLLKLRSDMSTTNHPLSRTSCPKILTLGRSDTRICPLYQALVCDTLEAAAANGSVCVGIQCEEAAKHFGVVALRDISANARDSGLQRYLDDIRICPLC